MSAVTHQLPLSAGAGLVTPSRRARVGAWAAPDPTALVLDPWAAPVGRPVALATTSPWSPPVGQSRVAWMASPAALLPAPTTATGRGALATLRALAETPIGPFPPTPSVERAGASSGSLLQRPPLPRPAPRVSTAFPAPDPATRVGATTSSASEPTVERSARIADASPSTETSSSVTPSTVTSSSVTPSAVSPSTGSPADDVEDTSGVTGRAEREGVHWRLVAMVSGVGAATAAVVTLISALF